MIAISFSMVNTKDTYSCHNLETYFVIVSENSLIGSLLQARGTLFEGNSLCFSEWMSVWWRKFLYLFCFCFRYPWGLHASCSNSLGKQSTCDGKRRDTGPSSGRGRDGPWLLCVWVAHFVFSSEQGRHCCAPEPPGCHTLTLGTIPCSLSCPMTCLCQVLLMFLTVFYCLGSPHLHPARKYW